MEVTSENVGFFAEIMNKYGVAVVISAVVIILFVIYIINDRKIIKKTVSDPMSKFTKTMIDLMSGMATAITDNFKDGLKKEVSESIAESIKNSHPSAAESNERDKIDLEMKNVLKELMKRTQSDRVYVFLYHNGGVSVSGFSFNKMSIISEADAPGIKLIAPENQAVQRGPYSEMIQSLKNDSEYFIPQVEGIKERDTVTYGWMIDRASRATYLKALKDHDRQVIGFFGIDYVTVHDMPTEEKIRLAMTEASVAVASLVIVGKYQKNLNGNQIVIK